MPAPFARLTLVLAAAAAAAVGFAARSQEAPRLDWQIERWKGEPGVQFSLSYRTEHDSSSNSHPAELAQFAGLTEAQLASPTLTTVRFALRRDAGDFDCDGSARADHASGSCDFKANAGFATVLKSYGYGPADAADLFQLAYADIGKPYLAELARQGYGAGVVDDLRRAGQHGVTLTYLREMGQAGYHADSLQGLVRIRDHGISIRYIQDLRAAGYTHPSLDELLRARDHGVSAQFATSLAGQGYRGLPLDTLVRLRDHGVTAGFAVRANAQAPDGVKLTADELIRVRDRGPLYARASDDR